MTYLLDEPFRGTLWLRDETTVPMVVLALVGGQVFGVIPPFTDDDVLDSTGVTFYGDDREVTVPDSSGEGACDLVFFSAPFEMVTEGAPAADAVPVHFNVEGSFPDLQSTVAAAPQTFADSVVQRQSQEAGGDGFGTPRAGSVQDGAATPPVGPDGAMTPPRGRGRGRAAGRGRGKGMVERPGAALPPAGRGRGVAPPGPPGRATVGTLGQQLASLASSVQALTSTVSAQGRQLEALAHGRVEEDLVGATPRATGDLRSLQREVLSAPSLSGLPAPRPARLPSSTPPTSTALRGALHYQSEAPPVLPVAPAPTRPEAPPGLERTGNNLPDATRTREQTSMLEAMQAQTAALTTLLRDRSKKKDYLAVLAGDDDGDDEDELKLPGAKGAASLEMLAQHFLANPAAYSTAVEGRLRLAASQMPGCAANPHPSARGYVQHEMAFGTFKTLGYLAWGIATAWDHLQAGSSSEAYAVLSMLLVAIEQVTLDDGRWTVGWVLTLLPEPPWGTMARKADTARPFGRLADPRWTAVAMAYLKDLDRLSTVRKGLEGKKGGGRGKDGAAAKPPE